MRKFPFVLISALFILSGCANKCQDKTKELARINNYVITASEFEDEFKSSYLAAQDSLESRKAFLDNLINKKLILQEAQSKGLDKSPEFLGAIERFWEQSLLKVALNMKSTEISGIASVTDKEVKEAYEKTAQSGKPDKTYEQAYQQLRWELIKAKHTRIMNGWLLDLRKRARISVDYNALKKQTDK